MRNKILEGFALHRPEAALTSFSHFNIIKDLAPSHFSDLKGGYRMLVLVQSMRVSHSDI